MTVELIWVYVYNIFTIQKNAWFSVHINVEVFCHRLEMNVSKQFIITELTCYSNNNGFA